MTNAKKSKTKIVKRLQIKTKTPEPTKVPVTTNGNGNGAVAEKPPVYFYKDQEVENMRPATPEDSFYIPGEDQVVVTLKNTHTMATAWRKELVASHAE